MSVKITKELLMQRILADQADMSRAGKTKTEVSAMNNESLGQKIQAWILDHASSNDEEAKQLAEFAGAMSESLKEVQKTRDIFIDEYSKCVLELNELKQLVDAKEVNFEQNIRLLSRVLATIANNISKDLNDDPVLQNPVVFGKLVDLAYQAIFVDEIQLKETPN